MHKDPYSEKMHIRSYSIELTPTCLWINKLDAQMINVYNILTNIGLNLSEIETAIDEVFLWGHHDGQPPSGGARGFPHFLWE